MFVRYGTDLIIFICQYLKCRPYNSRKTKHGKILADFTDHPVPVTSEILSLGIFVARTSRHFRTARVASAIIPITSAGYVPLPRSQRSQTVPLQMRRARLGRTPIRVQLRLFAAWRQRGRASRENRSFGEAARAVSTPPPGFPVARPTAVLRKKLIKAFFFPPSEIYIFLFFFFLSFIRSEAPGRAAYLALKKSKTSFDSS